MKRPPLHPILLNHFKSNPSEWIKKVVFYAVAEDFSPEYVGRELRTMEENGEISVSYYDGKYSSGLAQYKLGKVELPKKPEYQMVEVNGERRMKLI